MSKNTTAQVIPIPENSNPTRRTHPLLNPTLLAFLGALLLGIIYGRVAVFNLWGGVMGGDIDGYENLWDDYWSRKSLLGLNNPYFTNFMYYPTGISLRFHTLHPLTALFALPLWPIFGAVASTNLIFVFSLIFTNFFGYLLIQDFVKKPLVSFAGAALFTYANDQVLGFFGAGQTEKLSAQWLPLYLFFMFRLVYRPQQWKRYAALSLMCLFFLNFTDWQYAIYAVFTTVLFAGYMLFTRRSWQEKGWIFARLAGVGVVWIAIIFFPLLLPMINENSRNSWLNISYQSVDHSLDPLGYIRPDLTNPGYLAMGIMLFGAIVGWKKREELEAVRFWSICAFLATLFTLGPKLVINGSVTDIPGPYALLYQLPVFNSGRDPARFYTLALLGFGVLFAFGLKRLTENHFYIQAIRPYTWFAPVAVLAIVSISLFGFVAKSGEGKVDPLDTPEFYNQIAQDKGDYALLELPLFTEKGRGENVYQVYQFIHEKARFGGRWARDHKLANPNNFSKRATYVRDFFWLGTAQQNYYRPAQDIVPTPDFGKIALPILNYWKVGYIVLWKEALTTPGALEANQKLVQAALGSGVKPTYEDKRIIAYKVPTAPPLPEKLVLDIGGGWYTSEVNSTGPFRWVETGDTGAELYVQNLSDAPVRAKLSFKMFNFEQGDEKTPRTVNVAINGYNAGTYKFAGGKEEKAIDLELTIPPNKDAAAGFSIITLSSPEPALPANPDRTKDARMLSFGVRQVTLVAAN